MRRFDSDPRLQSFQAVNTHQQNSALCQCSEECSASPSKVLAVNLGTLLILGVNACAKGSGAGVEKIETSHIYLHDPHGRIVGEIGSEPGLGNDKDIYRPFIRFQDQGEKPVMTLYGTGLNLVQGDQRATFNFLGMDISSKKAEFIVNSDVLSYTASGGQMLVFSEKRRHGPNSAIVRRKRR